MYLDIVLEKYVRFVRTLYKRELFVVLDTELKIVYISPPCLRLTNKRSSREIIGKTIFEIASVPLNNQLIAQQEFQDGIKSNTRKQFFSTNLYRHAPYYSLLINFQPVTNPRQEESVMCALVEFVPVDSSYFYDLLINNDTPVEGHAIPDNETLLTRREHQVAFLLFHCKNLQEIARVIGKFESKSISTSTINNVIHRACAN